MRTTRKYVKRRAGKLPITVNAEIMSGTPVFTGTRVPVESLFTNLEGGVSLDDYLAAFPDVKREQAMAVLDYAQQSVLEAAA